MTPFDRSAVCLEQIKIDRKNDARRSLMIDDAAWRAKSEALVFPGVGPEVGSGYTPSMTARPSAPTLSQNTDRAQQSRCVIDQIEECCEGQYAEQGGEQHDQLVNILDHFILRAKREHQRKNEDTNGVFDDIVSQQRGGDNPGSHLRAGDLNGYEQRPKGENHERKRCRDEVCSSACEPLTLKPMRLHPYGASITCTNRVAINSIGMAMNGTTQSDDLI